MDLKKSVDSFKNAFKLRVLIAVNLLSRGPRFMPGVSAVSMSSRSATDALLHPDSSAARKSIITAINDSRIRLNIPEQELADDLNLKLADLSNLQNPSESKFKLSDILGLTALLGISLDRVLPLAPFTDIDRVYWLQQMKAQNAGPIASVNEVDLEEDVSISLYVRFQALTELFPED